MNPENRFIAKVHRLLPINVYREKMANPYRGGTPDCMYEGTEGYHWIEYKYLKSPPVRSFTPKISPLQLKWLTRAYENNRQPWVVVGHPDGCYILQHPESWEGPVKVFGRQLYTIKQLVVLIEDQVM